MLAIIDSSPIRLRLTLPIVEVPVHFLGRYEQVQHLPHRKLEVHLVELDEPPEVLVAFVGRAHAVVPVVGRRGQR